MFFHKSKKKVKHLRDDIPTTKNKDLDLKNNLNLFDQETINFEDKEKENNISKEKNSLDDSIISTDLKSNNVSNDIKKINQKDLFKKEDIEVLETKILIQNLDSEKKDETKLLSEVKKIEKKEKKQLSKQEYLEIKKVISENKQHKGPKDQKNSDNNIIEIKDVKKDFTNGYIINKIIKGISLNIEKGDFVVILGKSGSGKTTLMNILSGLNRASSGDVVVANKNLINLSDKELVDFRKRNIGYIFQEYGLLESLNVFDNVKIGCILNNELKKSQHISTKKVINKILKDVHMYEHRKKYPSELSGGQQQRISIARAIAKAPKIIFGDEPTSAVDSKMGIIILELLKKINEINKTTIVIITHDKNIAKIANKIFVLKDGYIDQFHVNEKPLTPQEMSDQKVNYNLSEKNKIVKERFA